jgi:hypothetical protein
MVEASFSCFVCEKEFDDSICIPMPISCGHHVIKDNKVMMKSKI